MSKQKKAVSFLILLVVLSALAGFFDYQPLFKKWSNFKPWSLGLDLTGGSYLVYDINLSEISPEDQDVTVEGLRDRIENRVSPFGVSEPRVYVEKSAEGRRLVVELAGILDVNDAINKIGEVPFLDFREVRETAQVDQASDSVVFAPTGLDGRYIKSSQIGFDNVTRQPIVQLEFNGDGADIFDKLTERNIGKPLGIFVDDSLISAPIVQQKITGGQAQITGVTLEEAKDLVQRLRDGALPAPIKLVNQQTIGADFGRDALKSSVFAGAIGTAVIILFMVLYYRRLGLFAGAALLMYVALTLAVFKIIPITLTLAGVAGFLLSIGMAVDANILVFERTKEELKKGLLRASAVEEGFRRAWPSIRDSNITTMISSIVLYYFTSSFVQGFALALFIGVVVSMFSAITVTRTLLRVFMK